MRPFFKAAASIVANAALWLADKLWGDALFSWLRAQLPDTPFGLHVARSLEAGWDYAAPIALGLLAAFFVWQGLRRPKLLPHPQVDVARNVRLDKRADFRLKQAENQRLALEIERSKAVGQTSRPSRGNVDISGPVAGGDGTDGPGGHVRVRARGDARIGPGGSLTGGAGGPGGAGGDAELTAGDGSDSLSPNDLVPLQDALRELYDEARNSIVIGMARVQDTSEDGRLSWLASALWGKVPLQVKLLISNKFEPLPHTIQRGRRVAFEDGKPLLMSENRKNEEHVEAREISILRSDLDKAIEIFKRQP